VRFALAVALVLVASSGHAEERDADWWRAAMASRERAVESSAEAVVRCEEREAPPAYDGVAGYVVPSARDGRPRYVEVKRCDAERDALEAARAELARFEDEARRSDVPPGWLRP
jgi:hypothetical protein